MRSIDPTSACLSAQPKSNDEQHMRVCPTTDIVICTGLGPLPPNFETCFTESKKCLFSGIGFDMGAGGVETFAVKAPIYSIACGQNEDA